MGSFFAYLIVAPQSSSTSVVRNGTNPSAALERFKPLIFPTSLDSRPGKCYYSPCKYYLGGNRMQHSPRKFWEVWGRSDALYNRWAAAHGVNNYRLFVLYVLDNHPGATQKAIADHAGLPKQTVNTVVRALRDEGYVTLSPASGDRREKNASLTPAGQTYARALLEPLYALEDAVFARMGDTRVQEMMDAIALFNMLFEKETEMIK